MQILKLTFDFSLAGTLIPNFRAAICEVVGRQSLLFHNHGADDTYKRDYPLIQYSIRRGRASIIGIGEGAVSILTELLPRLPDQLLINNQPYSTANYRVKMRQWEPQLVNEGFCFGLIGWVGLNQENYRAWKDLEGKEAAQRMLLGRALTGHIRALADGLQLPDHKQYEAEVLAVDDFHAINWHRTDFVRFHLRANSNLVLPTGINLGRMVAFGFGEVLSPAAYGEELKHRAQKLKSKKGQKAIITDHL